MSITNLLSNSDWSLPRLGDRPSESDFRKTMKRRSLWLQAFAKEPIEKSSVYVVASEVWGFTSPIDVHFLDANIFLVIFHGQFDRDKALDYPLQLFLDTWFLVRDWPSNGLFSPPDLHTIPIWLQIRFIPLPLQSDLAARTTAWFFESLLQKDEGFVDPNSGKGVMRLQVLHNIFNPLPLGFKTRFEGTKGVGVLFKYEDLGSVCPICGFIFFCNCKSNRPNVFMGEPQIYGTDLPERLVSSRHGLIINFNRRDLRTTNQPSLNYYLDIGRLESTMNATAMRTVNDTLPCTKFYHSRCMFREDEPHILIGVGPDQYPHSMKDEIVFCDNQPTVEGVLSDLEEYFMLPGIGDRALNELAGKTQSANSRLQWLLRNHDFRRRGNFITGPLFETFTFLPWEFTKDFVRPDEFGFTWNIS